MDVLSNLWLVLSEVEGSTHKAVLPFGWVLQISFWETSLNRLTCRWISNWRGFVAPWCETTVIIRSWQYFVGATSTLTDLFTGHCQTSAANPQGSPESTNYIWKRIGPPPPPVNSERKYGGWKRKNVSVWKWSGTSCTKKKLSVSLTTPPLPCSWQLTKYSLIM